MKTFKLKITAPTQEELIEELKEVLTLLEENLVISATEIDPSTKIIVRWTNTTNDQDHI
jgi:hypothetical protein